MKEFGLHYEELTIQIAELYSILLGISLWINHIVNKRVIVFTDNESVMYMLNKSTSSCPICMKMIRLITLWSMQCNTRIFSWHIKTIQNTSADLLSRGEVTKFLELFPGSKNHQELLPEEYWPFPVDWFN